MNDLRQWCPRCNAPPGTDCTGRYLLPDHRTEKETHPVTTIDRRTGLPVYDEATARARYPLTEEEREAVQIVPRDAIEEWCPRCKAAPGIPCTGKVKAHAERRYRLSAHHNRDVRRAPWPEYRIPGVDYRTPVKPIATRQETPA